LYHYRYPVKAFDDGASVRHSWPWSFIGQGIVSQLAGTCAVAHAHFVALLTFDEAGSPIHERPEWRRKSSVFGTRASPG
jgi:hypothetical protein